MQIYNLTSKGCVLGRNLGTNIVPLEWNGRIYMVRYRRCCTIRTCTCSCTRCRCACCIQQTGRILAVMSDWEEECQLPADNDPDVNSSSGYHSSLSHRARDGTCTCELCYAPSTYQLFVPPTPPGAKMGGW